MNNADLRLWLNVSCFFDEYTTYYMVSTIFITQNLNDWLVASWSGKFLRIAQKSYPEG